MAYSRRDLPLNALRAFEAVACERSFTAASQRLNVAQSAVSRHVARLETILARKLFVRAGRELKLTEAGEALLPVVSRAFDGMAGSLQSLTSDASLKLHVPPTFVQTIGTPFIRDFKAVHPNVALSVMTTRGTGRPDRDFDVAVTFDRVDDGRRTAELLWRIEMTPVCHPQDAARLRARGLEQALRDEELLHVQIEGHRHDHLWALVAAECGVDETRPSGLALETAALAIDLARAGAGIALADVRMLADPVASRGLVAPFDLRIDTGFGYFLLGRASRRPHPAEGDLIAHLRDLAGPPWSGGRTLSAQVMAAPRQ